MKPEQLITKYGYNRGGSKYNPDYHPKEFLELSRQGRQPAQIAAAFNIDKKTLYNWRDDPNKPEFTDAFNLGRTACEAWMIDQGYKIIRGEIKSPAAVWIYMMKACHGQTSPEWRAEKKIEITNRYENMTREELEKAIEAKLKFNTIEITPLEIEQQTIPND